MFAKYHYLSHSHNNAARVFVMLINGAICGFCSALAFPHSTSKNIWRGHRTVLLPDVQGVGLGSYLSNFVAQRFIDEGKRFVTTMSNMALIVSRQKDARWIVTRSNGRTPNPGKTKNSVNYSGNNSRNRGTVSFEYVGN